MPHTTVLQACASPVATGVPSDLIELADSWDLVAAGSGSPIQHYAWVSACAEAFATASDLRVFVVGPHERPVALAPLIRRSGALPRLELLGVRELYEPMDLVYQSPAAATTLAGVLALVGLPLLLQRVRADSPTVSAMKVAWRGSGVVICRPALGSPWIALDDRWGELEPPLNAGRRSDLRRAQRQAEKIGPVSCQIVAPAPEELDSLLDDVVGVEAASWKGRHGTALARDPVRHAFYRRYAAAACRAGILRLCFLRIGNRIAAAQIAVESEERFWLLKIGYDQGFARCSPGVLLLRETVRHAAQRGLRSYEFLGTPAPWIRAWTEDVHPCVSIRAYPARPCGVGALTADVARAAWCGPLGVRLPSAPLVPM